jgi:hypothetical protein
VPGSAFGHSSDDPIALEVLVGQAALHVRVHLLPEMLNAVGEVSWRGEGAPSVLEQEALRAALFKSFGAGTRIEVDGLRVVPIPRTLTLRVPGRPEEVRAHPVAEGVLIEPGERVEAQLVAYVPLTAPAGAVAIELGWERAYAALQASAEKSGAPLPAPVLGQLYAGIRGTELRFTREQPRAAWRRPEAGEALSFEVPPLENQAPRLPLGSLVLGGVALGALILGLRRRAQRARWVLTAAVAFVVAVGASRIRALSVPLPWGATSALSAEQQRAVFLALHRNVYRAFDQPTESAIYDTLAQSAAGSLLDDLYRDVYQSLVQREEGGAIGTAEAVEVDRLDLLGPEGDQGFGVRCAWRVRGKVAHWGHTHERENAYQARYVVRNLPEGVRIVEVEIERQDRLPADWNEGGSEGEGGA